MAFINIILLADFSVIKPTFGLLFWSALIFLIFWFVIGKLAFRSIIDSLNSRANDIQSSLDAAKKAKEEMKSLIAENDKIMAEARDEKMKIIKEAKEAANQIVAEAKEKAKEEANRLMVASKNDIDNAKKAALVDIKNQVGAMAIDIAEKVIRKDLASAQPHQEYVKRLVDEIKMN